MHHVLKGQLANNKMDSWDLLPIKFFNNLALDFHLITVIVEKTNCLVPSFVAEYDIKSVVITIDPQHQRGVLFYWCGNFVFDEEATVLCLQPKADGKTFATWWNIGEWHVTKAAVEKVELVITRVNYEEKREC